MTEDRYGVEEGAIEGEYDVVQRRADGELMDLKICGEASARWAKRIADALNHEERGRQSSEGGRE